MGGDALSRRRCSEFRSAGSSQSDAGPESAPEQPRAGMSIPTSTGAGLGAGMAVWGLGTTSAFLWAHEGTNPHPMVETGPVPAPGGCERCSPMGDVTAQGSLSPSPSSPSPAQGAAPSPRPAGGTDTAGDAGWHITPQRICLTGDGIRGQKPQLKGSLHRHPSIAPPSPARRRPASPEAILQRCGCPPVTDGESTYSCLLPPGTLC